MLPNCIYLRKKDDKLFTVARQHKVGFQVKKYIAYVTAFLVFPS